MTNGERSSNFESRMRRPGLVLRVLPYFQHRSLRIRSSAPGATRSICMKIIFAGTIGRSGLGGQAWASLQYLLGFRALGHEVFYLEDCGDCSWVYDWEKEEWTYDPGYPAAYLHECLEPFGFQD